MFSRTRTLLRIAGVDVRVDTSWLVIVVLVTLSFWDRFGSNGRNAGAAFVMAVSGAALFFASVLAHEVAHALEAKHRGVAVGGITLYFFGGATEMTSEARRPQDEFALTAVGPWTSLVLGCGFGLVAWGADRAGVSAVGEVAALLASLNVLLGLFNLLPGAPLDGGRILDSIVWRVTGDHRRARRVATSAGRALGAMILAVGVFWALTVAGGFVWGVWLAFIGWFLMQAAAAEEAQGRLRDLLDGRTAGSLLEQVPREGVPVDGNVPTVPADAPANLVLRGLRSGPVVVVTEDGEGVGEVTPKVLARLLERSYPQRRRAPWR